MKYFFPFFIVTLLVNLVLSINVNGQDNKETDWFATNTIKVAPHFVGVNYRGGSIMWESSCGLSFMSLQARYRYILDAETTDTTSTKLGHQMLELQPRFWLMRHMKFLYLMPSVALYSPKEWSAGAAIGFQYPIANRFVIDINGGVYRNNIVEDTEFDFKKQPIFTRFILGLGYQFSLKKNKNPI